MNTLRDLLETVANFALLQDIADEIFRGEETTIHNGLFVSTVLDDEDTRILNLLLLSTIRVLKSLQYDLDSVELDQELPDKAPFNKPRVLGYGIMAEYCKLDNRPDDVNQWERRYRDALDGKG
jgi:hypothetical protein